MGLKEVRGRIEQLRLLVRADGLGVLPRSHSLPAEGGEDRLEEHKLAAYVLHHRRGSLEGGSKGSVGVEVVAKHGWQLVQQRLHQVAALVKVDDKLGGKRQERLVQVRHAEHLGLGEGGFEGIEVQRGVERHEPNLCARAARELGEVGLDGGAYTVEHARLHRPAGDVDEEDEGWRLGGADHVVGRRHKLHGPRVQLVPLGVVPAATSGIERAVVIAWHVVEKSADVTSPTAAPVYKGDEGIHVGAAAATPDHAAVSEVDDRDGSEALLHWRVVEGVHSHAHRERKLLRERR
mmetsp:Transcript_31837/g.65920  ORF Transcript_31837/g.65920 Transcript_31837/m.65920 type:complete len:292 (-) Transcript_31837:327-1202(-)